MAARLLTKSRFKVGFECPTKLFYLDDPEYGNAKLDDAFLRALAEGGFQVGELAKVYHPGGIEIETLDKAQALFETAELLKKPSVIIFEAAIQFENLFIRADVLVKRGDLIELIEVKAKSFDPQEEDQFYNKTKLKKGEKQLSSSWESYLIDVAFQCHVLQEAHPEFRVSGFLMLADKSSLASVEGINQKFFLEKSPDGRSSARTAPGISSESLGAPLLVKVPVDDEIRLIWESNYESGGELRPFRQLIRYLSETCTGKIFVRPVVGSGCKGCEFRIKDKLKLEGKKSGFENCWQKVKTLKEVDFQRPFVFDIWNFRKSQALIDSGTLFIDELVEEDISPTPSEKGHGLSLTERQWLQIEKVKTSDARPYLDRKSLKAEFASWTYPLHFIDFETTMVAIPFHKGRKPYEQIAFQFSHHQVESDGTITHAGEYINRAKGKFPNFEFVRELKRALDQDEGTIFRYAAHENTVLNQIKAQMLSWPEPIVDRDELVEFIDSITTKKADKGNARVGRRNMIDLCELVKDYYYDSKMRGSNSIKVVLPAVLNGSSYLRMKYAAPIYGAMNGIKSLNFKDWSWITLDDNGAVKDPYKQLPAIFSDLDLEQMDSLIIEGSIADGGAAMTAYSRMQFTEMTEQESERVAAALLKYCELDTFAMVLIWEYWKSEISERV